VQNVPRPEKVETVREIEAALSAAESVVLVAMDGLSVPEATQLRQRFRAAGTYIKVYKNTLLHIAAANVGIQGLDPYLHGPTAVVVSSEEPSAGMKVLREFAKDSEKVRVKGGLLKMQVLTETEALSLADLPTRQQALGQLAGVLQAPMAGLARSLHALVSGLAIALNRVVEQQQAAAAES
jgi:large subunit ribosomal protein L10